MQSITLCLGTNLQSIFRSRKLLLLLLFPLFGTTEGLSQNNRSAGPVETALAGSDVARPASPSALGGNPAALCDTTATLFINFSPLIYGIPRYDQESAILLVPAHGGLGQRYGITAEGVPGYREIEARGTAAFRPAAGVSAGVSLAIRWLAIEHYGNRLTGGLDLGLAADITPRIAVGAALNNVLGGSNPADAEGERIALGFAFRAGAGTIISIDASKESRREPDLSLGFSTLPIPELTLRCGVGLGPPRISFGIGYSTGALSFEYGTAWLSPVGFRSSIGAGIRL